jgi:hypothetical protein
MIDYTGCPTLKRGGDERFSAPGYARVWQGHHPKMNTRKID